MRPQAHSRWALNLNNHCVKEATEKRAFPLTSAQNRIHGAAQAKRNCILENAPSALGPPSAAAADPPLLTRTPLLQLGPSVPR